MYEVLRIFYRAVTLCAAHLILLAPTGLRADDGVDGVVDGVVATTAGGVYTKAQAESGAALYEQHCLVCHDKKYFRPVLKRWEGQRLSVFFDVMAGSMPESNPGGLLDDEYLEILAYIFSRSRLPVGEEDLDVEDLSRLNIAHP